MSNLRQVFLRRSAAFFAAVMLALVTVLSGAAAVFAEDADSGRWGAAADEIDKYLDAGFEYYLEGDTKSAYDSVSDAFERAEPRIALPLRLRKDSPGCP